MQRALLSASLGAGACGGEPAPQSVAGPSRPDGGRAQPHAGGPSESDATPSPDAGEHPAAIMRRPDAGLDSRGASSAPDGGTPESPDASLGGAPGSLQVTWMHGAANCAESTDPEHQLHAYNATTFIIRQDKCRTFEAPFVYLLLGADTALLLDTGATNGAGLRERILPLVGSRALLVAHTHAHGDHVASDARFAGQAATTVIGADLGSVQAAFGIDPWPNAAAELDLGERVLDVLAIPGHEQAHIALYDRETGLLFTGDTLYPGLLFINDWTTYRASVRRLAEFVLAHPIAHVLGAHIEMTSTPSVYYPYGTIHQPEEHVLELQAAHVLELDAALQELGPTPPQGLEAHADFVIAPE